MSIYNFIIYFISQKSSSRVAQLTVGERRMRLLVIFYAGISGHGPRKSVKKKCIVHSYVYFLCGTGN